MRHPSTVHEKNGNIRPQLRPRHLGDSASGETIGEALDTAAERWPDREAVVVRDQTVSLTFAALRQEADRLAAGFIALGLRPGGRVGIWSPNSIGWVLTQYASGRPAVAVSDDPCSTGQC
jgi:acyl-CoA synthetase (AMP-forming)/AMP-acid ligase II